MGAALVLAWTLTARPASASHEGDDFRFRRIGAADGLVQGSVYTILQDRRGFVWLGTQDGLHRYDGEEFTVLRPEPFEDRSLSHGLVQALAEDRDGLLWAGTFRGLNRLAADAASFDRFLEVAPSATWEPSTRAEDLEQKGEPVAIEALALDGEGSLWVASLGQGLYRLRRDGSDGAEARIETFRHDPAQSAGLPSDRLRALAVSSPDDAGGLDPERLWIGFDDGTVAYRPLGNGGEFEVVDPALLPGGSVRSLLVDRAGTLWVGTTAGLGALLPDGTSRIVRRVSGDVSGEVSGDAGQGGAEGADTVTALLEDHTGRLWVGTLGGGLCLFRAGAPYRCFRHDPANPESLGNDHVRALAEDAGGLIWVGTAVGGVTLVDTRSRFGVVRGTGSRHGSDGRHGLPRDVVRSFAEDAAGGLWIGTDGGGLVRWTGRGAEGAAGHVFERPVVTSEVTPGRVDELATDRVWSLHVESPEPESSSLWIGGQTRLWRLGLGGPAAGELASYRHDDARPGSLGSGSVRWIVQNEDGLWLALFGGGVDLLPAAEAAKSPDTASFRHLRRQDGLVSDLALVLFADRSGQLWIGTAEGLSRRTLDGRLYTYRHDPEARDSLLGDIVRTIHQDPEGDLWVGTDGGLNVLPAERVEGPPGAGANRTGFRAYTEADGLPNHTVYGILPDDQGRLWLSTNRGLARFDPETEDFVAFDLDDGLQDMEFNGGAQLRASDGTLLFGGVSGFNVFDPSRVDRNLFVPPVVITSIRLLDGPVPTERPIWHEDEITLGHEQSIVSFRFAALDYSDPDENRYAYRLDPLSEAWHDLGTDNDLTFTDLDAGDYVLRVRGSNDDGLWNEGGAALRIRVRPAPWRTWWAYSLYALAAALAAALALAQVRRRRTLQQRIHEVVRTSERRLDLALRGSGDGLWDWDLVTGEIYRSHVDHLLGADTVDRPVDRPFADLEIHPEDLPQVEQALSDHLAGASDRFEVEYRLRDHDGGWRWILDRGNVVERGEDGTPRRMAGTFKDMTAHKQTERELRLWSAVFETVSEGVVILDTEGTIRAVNPAYCDLTGREAEEVVGRPGTILESDRHPAGFYRRLRATLRRDGRWQGEAQQRRADGGTFHAWVDVHTVRDDAGAPVHFVVVLTDITRRKENEEELRRLANYDPLTGLPNRSQFRERFERALAAARVEGHRLALLFGDLDRFKQVNDTLGHGVGDRLLQEAARRLLGSVRERDLVARLGGDEFTVLLTRVASDEVVVGVAERILASFRRPIEDDGHALEMSTSLGIALFPGDGDDVDSLLAQADAAMYAAKADGRSRYRFASAGGDEEKEGGTDDGAEGPDTSRE